jgi:hypothetical protein
MYKDGKEKNHLETGDDFDTTAQLWDRLVEDISQKGAPCLETLEKLVDDACGRHQGRACSSLRSR